MIARKKRNSGVITVLVAGLLVGILALGTLVLELGRFVAAQTQLSASAGSASTSMIAYYDTTLFERYGLMAIDTDSFTETRCRDYLLFNSDLNNSYNSNNLSTLYDVNDVELTGLYNLTYPSVLKRQLLSRAKYHVVPSEHKLNIDTAESFFQAFKDKCEYVSSQMDRIIANGTGSGADTRSPDMIAALDALAKTFNNSEAVGGTGVVTNKDYDLVLSDASVSRLPSSTGTVESPSTADDEVIIENTVLNAIDKVGVDISSFGSVTEYNETDISSRVLADMDGLAQHLDMNYSNLLGKDCYTGGFAPSKTYAEEVKALTQSIPAALQMLQSDLDGNLLLNSYIAGYFSNKNRLADAYMGPHISKDFNATADNTTFYAACAEYILAGNASETENQSDAYRSLLTIRLINNLYMLLNQPGFNPNDSGVVATYLAWAYYESCTDLWLMSEYNIAVPFNKTEPLLPLGTPAKVAAAFDAHDFADGMDKLGWHNGTTFVIPGSEAYSYTDSIALAMWFVPNSTKLMRVADLIQLEMRYREQYVDGGTAAFLMSEQNTYCRVKVTARLRAMLPIISLGNNGSIQGTTFRAIRYSGY